MEKLIVYDKFDINCENPVAVLHNAYNVKITEKLNAEYTLEFNNPKDNKSQYIKEESYAKCADQIFKIKNIEQLQGKTGIVYSVKCEHIFYEMLDEYITESENHLNTPNYLAEILNTKVDSFEIKVEGNFDKRNCTISRGNPVKTVQRILDKWELELYRDNRNVTIKSAINSDKIQLFRSGKNIENFKRLGNTEAITTRLHLIGLEGLVIKGLDITTVPFYNELDENIATFYNNATDKVIQFKAEIEIIDGVTVLKNSYIDSKYITDYPKVKNDERLNDEIDNKLELLMYGLSELKLVEQKVETYDINVIELSKTKGDIEKFGLGYTVILQDKDVLADKEQNKILSRIIEYVYYPFEFNNSTVKIGFYNDNVLGFLGELQKAKEKVEEKSQGWDKIFDMIDGDTISTKWLNDRISKSGDMITFGTGNVICDNRGLMVLDTNSIDTAKAIIILTVAIDSTVGNNPILGIARRGNTTEAFVYRTAIDSNGMNADEIVAGTIKTSLVKIYGDSNFYWDSNGLYIGNPDNTEQYIKLDKEGFRFTTDGGQSFAIEIGWNINNVATKDEVSIVDGKVEDAKTDATNALTKLNDITNDSKLTSDEKATARKEWDTIQSEKIIIDAQADLYNVDKTNYSNAYNTLNTYIAPLLSNSTTSDIDRNTFDTNFKNYYDEKVKLLNEITDKTTEGSIKEGELYNQVSITNQRGIVATHGNGSETILDGDGFKRKIVTSGKTYNYINLFEHGIGTAYGTKTGVDNRPTTYSLDTEGCGVAWIYLNNGDFRGRTFVVVPSYLGGTKHFLTGDGNTVEQKIDIQILAYDYVNGRFQIRARVESNTHAQYKDWWYVDGCKFSYTAFATS